MNFGGKIVILYLSFVALILTLVFNCYSMDVDLVSTDYYAQEINFQQKINATNNEKDLPSSITHVVNDQSIILSIDSALLSKDFQGTVTFFRPSDSKKDVSLKMNFVNYKQVIDAKELIHGAYKLQLSWTSNKKNYFKEDVIFIN
ncbi:MAG: FixH family protein [Bacteroidetes bacterium]|nr:FixH family protein [Bacteroidota bacterium]